MGGRGVQREGIGEDWLVIGKGRIPSFVGRVIKILFKKIAILPQNLKVETQITWLIYTSTYKDVFHPTSPSELNIKTDKQVVLMALSNAIVYYVFHKLFKLTNRMDVKLY